MARLTEYFKRKLASSISRRVPQQDGAAQYEYTAEVIQVHPDAVVVNVTRRTFNSAGLHCAGSDAYLGDHVIPLVPTYGLEDFWRRLIRLSDPLTATSLILPWPADLRDPHTELLEE